MRQNIEERGFTDVGITDKRHTRHLLAQRVLRCALTVYRPKFFFQFGNTGAYDAAVGLKLGFAGSFRADATVLLGKVRPHTCQTRKKIFKLGKLDLCLRLARAGMLRKDIKYKAGAV